MATIGTFTEKDGWLTGKIQTLCINTSLAFVPNENRSNSDAPTFHVRNEVLNVAARLARRADTAWAIAATAMPGTDRLRWSQVAQDTPTWPPSSGRLF